MDIDKLNLEKMRQDIAEILHEDAALIRDDDNLMDWGLDSIRAMMLFTRWREKAVHLNFAEMMQCSELGAWWILVQKSIKQN